MFWIHHFEAFPDAQGAVFAWPLLLEQRTVLPAPKVAEAVWAASAVPSPPKERVDNGGAKSGF